VDNVIPFPQRTQIGQRVGSFFDVLSALGSRPECLHGLNGPCSVCGDPPHDHCRICDPDPHDPQRHSDDVDPEPRPLGAVSNTAAKVLAGWRNGVGDPNSDEPAERIRAQWAAVAVRHYGKDDQ
jgi:hypothetical protein